MGGSIDRRAFLKLGAASAGAAIGCGGAAGPRDAPPGGMRYRPLGATGLRVSEVAFGAHGVDNAGVMAAALEAGVTTFCTSGGYLDGREETALGEAIARIGVPRERLVLMTGADLRGNETVDSWLRDLDASLRRLRTDVLDIYYNAMVQTPAQVRSEVLLEAFDRARAAGKVRHLGVSGHHGGLQECLEAALECGAYEVFFTKYDFVSYPDQDQLLRRAAARGIGTMVFKTTAGNRQREIKDLEAGGLSFRQATIRWALSNPDVASVAVTMTSFDRVSEAVAAVGASLSAAEVAMLRRYAGEMYHRYCRFCATCEGSCPHHVAVAEVMRYQMYFAHYGREKEAMRLYGRLPSTATAAPCRACAGHCDDACPFGRAVREGLVAAHEQLSFARA
ncbi:MAG: aldo/keto reductase [Thermoanaerobaculales bacterium]|jgi:aryl-alcohol dehydrogenase-like predicted oxidoreductase|nr:aldo/keto reductase [Thermoanaerobaculales bacterium]